MGSGPSGGYREVAGAGLTAERSLRVHPRERARGLATPPGPALTATFTFGA